MLMKPTSVKFVMAMVLLALGAVVIPHPVVAAPSAAEILKQSDAARGGGFPGVTWDVKVTAVGDGDTQEQGLNIKADANNSLVEFISPPKIKGQKLLMVSNNMWFIRPGLSKPAPISARQRLLGQAANGDVAATNYSGDYEATLLGEETVNGDPTYKLELKAKNTSVTYDRILYWVSKVRQVGVKAEFYTVSNKLFKQAQFEYGNRINYQGKNIPFVSKMIIQDAINPAQQTTLEYSNIQTVALPADTFNLNFLVQ